MARAALGVRARGCEAPSVTEQEAQFAFERALLRAPAARWATDCAGRGEAIGDIAATLGCCWHTVDTSVRRWGQAILDADTQRISAVRAFGARRDRVLLAGKDRSARLVNRHRRCRLRTVPRCGARPQRPRACPLAAGVATAVAGAGPLGDVGPLWPLPRDPSTPCSRASNSDWVAGL